MILWYQKSGGRERYIIYQTILRKIDSTTGKNESVIPTFFHIHKWIPSGLEI